MPDADVVAGEGHELERVGVAGDGSAEEQRVAEHRAAQQVDAGGRRRDPLGERDGRPASLARGKLQQRDVVPAVDGPHAGGRPSQRRPDLDAAARDVDGVGGGDGDALGLGDPAGALEAAVDDHLDEGLAQALVRLGRDLVRGRGGEQEREQRHGRSPESRCEYLRSDPGSPRKRKRRDARGRAPPFPVNEST